MYETRLVNKGLPKAAVCKTKARPFRLDSNSTLKMCLMDILFNFQSRQPNLRVRNHNANQVERKAFFGSNIHNLMHEVRR